VPGMSAAEVYFQPLCTCCAHITGRPPTPAIYEWTGPNGTRSLLCVSCCAIWRKNAAGDPSLLPREIHQLPGDWQHIGTADGIEWRA